MKNKFKEEAPKFHGEFPTAISVSRDFSTIEGVSKMRVGYLENIFKRGFNSTWIERFGEIFSRNLINYIVKNKFLYFSKKDFFDFYKSKVVISNINNHIYGLYICGELVVRGPMGDIYVSEKKYREIIKVIESEMITYINKCLFEESENNIIKNEELNNSFDELQAKNLGSLFFEEVKKDLLKTPDHDFDVKDAFLKGIKCTWRSSEKLNNLFKDLLKRERVTESKVECWSSKLDQVFSQSFEDSRESYFKCCL